MGKKDGGDPETGGGGGQRAAVGGRRFYHADPGAICGLSPAKKCQEVI